MSALKELLNAAAVGRIAQALKSAHPEFPADAFRKAIVPKLGKLEFKGRCQLIAQQITAHLKLDYAEACAVLVKALGQERDPDGEDIAYAQADDAGLTGFLVWPLTDFVAREGLDHHEISLEALREMTRRFSAEFAVRPFLKHDLRGTLKRLAQWKKHPSPHVRRLVSEGTRPFLPWGERLSAFVDNPALSFELLEGLAFDDSLYVRRSVANHLNDLSKKHPEAVLKTLTAWHADAKTDADRERIDWVARHACRGLFKQGHPGALQFFGFRPAKGVSLRELAINPKKVKIGDKAKFEFELVSSAKSTSKLMVDYVVHYRKARGGLSPKVFKLTELELRPKETRTFSKQHDFQNRTIRKHFAGAHRLEILVNGAVAGGVDFMLQS